MSGVELKILVMPNVNFRMRVSSVECLTQVSDVGLKKGNVGCWKISVYGTYMS